MADRLRPLKVTEVVDRSFALYRENLWLFYAIAGCVYLPTGVMSVLLGAYIRKVGLDPSNLSPGKLLAYFAIGAVLYCVLIAVTVLSQGSLAVAVADRYLDLPITFSIAYGRTWRRVLSLGGAFLLTGLALGAGFCACVVPGVWVWLGLSFAPQVVMLEGLPATKALTRSWHLTRGDRLRILGLVMLMSVAIVSIYGTSTFLAHVLFRSDVVAGVVTQVGYSAIYPVMHVALVLIYFDSRVRKEGFDVALLAAQVSAQRAAAPAPAQGW